MNKILVTGSIAYDHLMTFDGNFADSMLADQLENLSVSFLASSHEHYFGGCAANIAYSLKQLSCEPIMIGVAGSDFDRYLKWLEDCKIDTSMIFRDENANTAASYVLTDNRQKQISIYSPGSNLLFPEKLLNNLELSDVRFAIIGPDMPGRMLSFGRYFSAVKIPYIFDPGQAIPALTEENLVELISGCIGVIANEYEFGMLEKIFRKNIEEIAAVSSKQNIFLIRTTGKKGCEFFLDDSWSSVPTVGGLEVKDITGAGDAFRAGFLNGFVENKSLVECCKIANVCASFAIEQKGTQKHKFHDEIFKKRLGELKN